MPVKKALAKLNSASKSKPATPRPPTDVPLSSRTRGSKRKTTLHIAFAAEQRSKHKKDTSITHPILLDEPEFKDKPEPLSIYHPTVKELSASMDDPVLKKRIFDSDEEESAALETEPMETVEGSGVAADVAVLIAPILTVPGPLPTTLSQFESGEPLRAPNSYTRIGYNKPSNTRRKMI
nr:hypothetical protein CFP56_49678 [Quercus suber]